MHISDTPTLALNPTRRTRLRGLLLREYSVTQGSLILMLAFLVSAVLGIARQVLFNARFGAGAEASAYVAAFRLPETIGTLLAGGTLANAFVPVLLRAVREDGQAAAQRLISLVLTALSAVLALLALVALLLTPVFVRYVLAPGFDPATSALAITLTRIMLGELLLMAASSVANAVLLSRNQLMLPALAIAARNIALIGGISVAIVFPQTGVYGPTLGVLGDGVLQLLILLPGLRQQGARVRLLWAPADQRLREVVKLLIPSGLAGAVNYAGWIVDTSFGSLAREAAALPALFNANLLIGLPIRLLGYAIAQAVFPTLAAQAAAQQWRPMRRTLLRALGVACGLSLVAALALVAVGRPLVRVLFEHGHYTAADGTLTYTLFTIYACALPAYIGTEILTRGLIALYDTRTPLVTNCLQLAGRAALIAPLLPALGVIAIPIAFAATSALETLALGVVLWIKLRRGQSVYEQEILSQDP